MSNTAKQYQNGPIYPLDIFYDGDCLVCSTEMEHYRRNNPEDRFNFIDIRAGEFHPEEHQRSVEEFQARLHVRDASGRFVTGVEAFLLIWRAYPKGSAYRWLAVLVDLPLVRQLAKLGYRLFARFRHLLPKRSNCESGTCRIDSHR